MQNDLRKRRRRVHATRNLGARLRKIARLVRRKAPTLASALVVANGTSNSARRARRSTATVAAAR